MEYIFAPTHNGFIFVRCGPNFVVFLEESIYFYKKVGVSFELKKHWRRNLKQYFGMILGILGNYEYIGCIAFLFRTCKFGLKGFIGFHYIYWVVVSNFEYFLFSSLPGEMFQID